MNSHLHVYHTCIPQPFFTKWEQKRGLDVKLTYQLTNVRDQKCELSEMSMRLNLASPIEARIETRSTQAFSSHPAMSQPGLQLNFRNHVLLPCTLLAQLTSHISHTQHKSENVAVLARRGKVTMYIHMYYSMSSIPTSRSVPPQRRDKFSARIMQKITGSRPVYTFFERVQNGLYVYS